ncbi:Putative acetyltransferase [Aquirufa nivalisilvae]|uniref:Acetyltransferase n=1 Tax=Aquirufa nivalisilvae TaxID=2516557 RepID=A0A2S2DYC9_9BACT|nr:acyltransferase [Aquirufa nivalisilvae]AWL10333.1 Putative acetyltransferase [Aquirufa nivalisilvae]
MGLKRKLKYLINSIIFKFRFIGQDIHIHPSCYISSKAEIKNSGKGKIIIGKNCEIHPYAMILSYGGEISIGDHCSLNPFSIIYGHGGVQIGNSVRIASHSVIIPANHIIGDSEKNLHESGLTSKGISIQNNVWIGSGCRILDGVSIGFNSVIAAGAVVNKSVDSSSIVGGIPARIIKNIKINKQ